jgi:hypothetical protein
MASSYSDLKIELIGTGDQTGTWGTTTNNNFSVAISEAITGSADVAFSSADVTVTLTDSNAAQTARNLRLNLTGTSGGARQLILGSGCQIEKLYLINNGLADAVTVKNTSGTGIAVPAGKSMFVFNNGTNVVDAITHLSSLTLGSALPVASGGTGVTASTGTVAVVLSTSPTLVTPALGTPSSGTLSSCTVDGTNLVGYLNIPQNSKSADYTLTLADAGEQIFHPSADTSARTFTIPANSSVAFTIGTAITFINQNAAGVVTIAITTDTMRLAGAGTTGSRTLAANGIATCVKVTSTEWIISGTGLT